MYTLGKRQHVSDGRIPQSEEVRMVWTSERRDKDDATKDEMTIPGEGGYGQ